MSTVATEQSIENPTSTTITTTLYDLIAAMQDNVSDPIDEALIVPTVANWLRSGKITFPSDHTSQSAA